MQILKSRDHNLEDFMKQLEANKGILGYTNMQVWDHAQVAFV